MSDSSWAAQIGIVNESTSLARAGNVSIFRSAVDACLFFDECCGAGFVVSPNGDRLNVRVGVDGRMTVERATYPEGQQIVRGWLEARAAKTLADRRRAALRGELALNALEERGEIPSDVEELITYIGFSG